MKILLIEDDEDFSRPLAIGLRKAGYFVDVVESGVSGLFQAENFDYDLVLLDLNLPDLDGISICRKLKEHSPELLICIISARDAINQRVEGLDTGADDYLVKPIHLQELLARIRALLRRRFLRGRILIEIGGLILDPVKREVFVHDVILRMTAKEYAILEYLATNQGVIINQCELIQHTWGEEEALFSNSLRTHIYVIRRKLKEAGLEDVELTNVVNQGYCLRIL